MQTAERLLAAIGAVAIPVSASLIVSSQAAQAQALPKPTYVEAAPSLRPTLPAPAYMRGPSAAPTSGGSQRYDRYGGGTAHPSPRLPTESTARTATPAAYAGPRLSWTGKIERSTSTPLYPSRSTPAAAPVAMIPTSAASAPKVSGEGLAAASQPYAPAAQPSSIYDPSTPISASTTQQANTSSVRRYSVAREFGSEPDPIPLPPQFFGPTADLTQPETGDAVRKTLGSDGKARNAIQPGDGQ